MLKYTASTQYHLFMCQKEMLFITYECMIKFKSCEISFWGIANLNTSTLLGESFPQLGFGNLSWNHNDQITHYFMTFHINLIG